MTRRGEPPDNINWYDAGCDVSPSCLACPLPACKYEMSRAEMAALRAKARVPLIHSMRAQGLNDTEVAQRLGVSRRAIYRSLYGS